MDTREIYSRIYDITSQNMLENDMELEYSRDVFLFATECPVGECDVLDMCDLDNMSFLEAAYVALFFRTADPSAYVSWKKHEDMYASDFRRKLLNSLAVSREFMDKSAILKNNIYSNKAELNRAYVQGSAGFSSANKAVNKLYRIYKKFPNPIKKFIKKILGVNDK